MMTVAKEENDLEKEKEKEGEKKRGRDNKYSVKELKELIRIYNEKHKNTITQLKPFRIAAYFKKNLKMDISYQDFTRNKIVKAYITKFNEKLMQEMTKGSGKEKTPIYTPLNIPQIMKKCNTPAKIEPFLRFIDSNLELLHKRFGELREKLVNTMEKNVSINNELKKSKEGIAKIEQEHTNVVKELRKQIKDLESKNKVLHSKTNVYEGFLKKHHWDTVSEYALYLEGIITAGVSIDNGNKINIENYKSGNYDLSDVINAYDYITSTTVIIEENEVKSIAVIKDSDFNDEVEDEALINGELLKNESINLMSKKEHKRENLLEDVENEDLALKEGKDESQLLEEDIFSIFSQFE